MEKARKSKQGPQKLNFDDLASIQAELSTIILTLDSTIANAGSVSDSSVFSLNTAKLKNIANDLQWHCKKISILRNIAHKLFRIAAAKEKALGEVQKTFDS